MIYFLLFIGLASNCQLAEEKRRLQLILSL